MICKYCHENTHYIDVCPIIICKICKDIGHPQWLCIKKKNNKMSNNISSLTSMSTLTSMSSSNSISPTSMSNKSLNDNKSLIDNTKKVLIIKDDGLNNLSDKNLNYYIKNIDETWDNFFM